MLVADLRGLRPWLEPLLLRDRAPFTREHARLGVDHAGDHARRRQPVRVRRALPPALLVKLGPRWCRKTTTARVTGDAVRRIVPEPESRHDRLRVSHTPHVRAVVRGARLAAVSYT